MPIESNIDPHHGVVTVSVDGVITVEELVTGYESLLSNPEFRASMPVIWNLSKLPLTKIPVSEVRRLPQALHQFTLRRGHGYKAALVTARSADFHLLRVYLVLLTLIGDVRIKLFRSQQEALDWILS